MTISKLGLLFCVSISASLAGCGEETSPVEDLANVARDMTANVDMVTAPDLLQVGDMAGFQLVQGCGFNEYVDATVNASLRTISPWDQTLGKKCLRIKVGQTVTWSPTPSSTHPLFASGGTMPSPITSSAQATATFNTAGVYGFQCGNHPTQMLGGIWVEP